MSPPLPKPPSEKAPRPLIVVERVQISDDLHPGWVRATAILLRGLARLKDDEQKPAK